LFLLRNPAPNPSALNKSKFCDLTELALLFKKRKKEKKQQQQQQKKKKENKKKRTFWIS
jgi:hypothetical protein